MSLITRRAFLEKWLLGLTLGPLSSSYLFGQSSPADGDLSPAQLLLDMVHNNPGEAPFVTHYNDPAFLKQLGYHSKVYELFEGAQFGIDWSSVDPEIFPAGSVERTWVDAKAAQLDRLYTATKAAGLDVYCHTDMVVFPKRLVDLHQLKNFRQVSDPETQKYLRLAVQQMFERFPQVDGLVIRIGETYLQGAPYHTGGISENTNAEHTIIPLMQLLRDEACDRLNKKIIFRAWDSFDVDMATYRAVSAGVEPHPNLVISVKHCEGDFHRGNPFSKVLGVGRHPQVVEVQCQREYEGKAAYPNYIAHGVIDGFEEHHGQSIRRIWSNPIITGMFTWSRGGGWKGPYITNELWCDVNAYVLSHWAQDPNRAEEDVFGDYCRQILRLSDADADIFRKLCLLSADAVYRGIRSTKNDISPWWTRDQFIGRPPLPGKAGEIPSFLAEKDEAVAMWDQMIAYAQQIAFPDPATKEYAVTSCLYGSKVYRIYRAGFNLAALGMGGDKAQIKSWLDQYDQTWAEYRQLKVDHPSCATLYEDKGFMDSPGIGAMVDEFRRAVA